MGRKTHGKATKPARKKRNSDMQVPSSEKSTRTGSWVDKVEFVCANNDHVDETAATTSSSFTIVSWNVLAQAFCSRRSQSNLPEQYQQHVFHRLKRKERIIAVLQHFSDAANVDVICLQEVDLPEIGAFLQTCGYVGVETPRAVGAGGRVDACAVYVKQRCGATISTTRSDCNWEMMDHEMVRLDDLANSGDTDLNISTSNRSKIGSTADSCSSTSSMGVQLSFMRRNMALICRIRNSATGLTVVVANAHLFWNPGFEYVKLCQAHYILTRVQAFQATPTEPVVFCGDLNSRPHGMTHSYLTLGSINAKLVAPWYAVSSGEEIIHDDSDNSGVATADTERGGMVDDRNLANGMNHLNLFDTGTHSNKKKDPQIRYLLDASLNKLCRWLRILGQDVAMETDEEERRRTSMGDLAIFDRCRSECRTLVTTSPRLVVRRDCPASAYCIHPNFVPALEAAMVHMLLTHGVVLEPETFLSRCVVCNGNILEVDDSVEKRRILSDYEAPQELIDEGMAVYRCNGCRQGYWWNDMPSSSASRVKSSAIRLFELCVKGGVPVRGPNEGILRHMNIRALREQGWDTTTPGSQLLDQRLDVIDWLKDEQLKCPFPLESAYAYKEVPDDLSDTSLIVSGEVIPFTNVTHDFVSTLDYVFFDKTRLKVTERLYVPSSFPELSDGRTNLANAHLLPSDVWPSDHLAVGARLCILPDHNVATEEQPHNPTAPLPAPQETPYVPTDLFCVSEDVPSVPLVVSPFAPHSRRCACGCVPAIPSLFEMAALRKQAAAAKKAAG